MSLFIYIDGVEQSAVLRLESGFHTASAAELGTVSVAQLQVDDPDGTINIVGWKAAYIVETAATPPRLWTGFIGARTIERGPYRTGAGRVWTCEAVDVNWNLTRRVIRSASGKRPAETDLARLTWLLGHVSLSGLVYSGTITNLTGNPITLGEADYRGQFPMDVLADITPVSGKTAWVRWNDTTSRNELFYDQTTAAVDSSTLRLSNVLSDVDSVVTFAPYIDASMERTPEDTYSGVLMQYQKGFLYTQNATTLATFAERDLSYSTTRIGLATTAQTNSTLMLTARSVERETVTVSVRVPTANVNDVREGQRISVKFSHLPGLTAFTWTRVVRKNVAQLPDLSYVLTLTLSTSIRPSLNAGSPADFPYVASPPSVIQQISGETTPLIMPSPITPGSTLILSIYGLIGAGGGGFDYVAKGYTLGPLAVNGGTQGTLYKIAGAAESQTLDIGPGNRGTWYEVPGTWVPGTSKATAVTTATGNGIVMTSGPITVPASSMAFAIGVIGTGGAFASVAGSLTFTPGTGWTEDLDARGTPNLWTGHAFPAAGSLTAQTTNSANVPSPNTPGFLYDVDVPWTMHVVDFTGSASDSLPSSGQMVYDEVPTPVADGTTTTFTLAYAFADGSLLVKVDRLDQTLAVTSYDGVAKTFTLGFAPKTGEKIEVTYQGR